MRVVIAPQTPTSEEVLACLRSWSASGLLEPFCWWQASPADEGEPGFEVDRVQAGGLHREPLATALGGQPPERTALVAFYPARAGDGFDARFTARVGDHLAAAADVFAFRRHTTECTMIVTPAEIGQPVPPEMFDAQWETNVYVAPEDRSSPQDVNVLPGDDARFPMHAAHALATLADLWVAHNRGEYTVLGSLGPGAMGDYAAPVQVARCFSRVLDFGYLPDHLAARVFRPGHSWPNPDPRRYDIVSDPSKYVPYLVRRYLETHEEVLGLSVVEPIKLPPPPEYGLLEALWLLLTDLIWRIRRAPGEKLNEIRTSVYNKAASVVQSKGGRKVRPLKGKSGGKRQVEEMEAELDRPLIVPDGPVAAAWTDLRRLAFGLVDGSDLPAGIDEESLRSGSTLRAVVVDPRRLVPNPKDEPPATPDGRPRACDPLNLEARFLPVDPDAELEQADPEADLDADAPTFEVDQERWVHPHLDTPLWMIGASIATALKTAEAESAQPRQADASEDEQTASDDVRMHRARRRRRRLRRSVLMSLLMALAAGYGVWETLSLPLRPVGFLVIAAAWVVWTGNLARKALLRDRDEQQAELQAELDRINRAILRAQRAGDAIRLARRYEEYLDWAEAVGWMAHHPWVGSSLTKIDVRTPIDLDTLPAAATVALAQVGDGLDTLARRAQRQLFSPRWLADVYAGVEDATMGAAAGMLGYAGDEQGSWPDPATDTSEDPDSPRRQLVRALRRGDHRHLDESDLAANLLDFLDVQPLDALAKATVPLDGRRAAAGIDELLVLPPAVGWFLPPDGIDEVADAVRSSVVRVCATRAGVAVGGSGVVVGDGVIATARSLIDECDEITVSTADEQSSPVEVLCTSPTTDLALLSVADLTSAASASLDGAGSPINQGDPVITLGHPTGQEGAATVGWGLVTATGRHVASADPSTVDGDFPVFQVSYDSPRTAWGAPVFDLHGRVVGISATAVQGDGTTEDGDGHRGLAVPVDDLHALLASKGGTAPASSAAAPDGNGRRPAAPGPRPGAANVAPSAFLGAIAPGPGPVHLLPQHWVSPDADEEVARFLPEEAAYLDGDTPIGRLSGGARFLEPIRVLFHRTDLPHPSRSDRLASCAPSSEDSGT